MRVLLAAIVPAYNEQDVIADTIRSLLAAGISPEDIYILDDASTDSTAATALPFGVTIVRNEKNRGKAETIASALQDTSLLSRYSHICFLDADTLVDPTYFKVIRNRLSKDLRECDKCNPRYCRRPIGVLCGNPKSLPHNWLTAWRAYQYFLADFIHRPGQSAFRSITVAPGCATVYAADVLKTIRLCGDTPVEDMDFTVQAALLGTRIVYESKMIVYTQDPRRLRNYIGQVRKRWLSGAWQVMHKYGLLWKGIRSPLHWECRISMLLEPIMFLLSLYWSIGYPRRLTGGCLLTIGTNIVLAAVASYKEKRWDIVLYSPLYIVMWLLDFVLFIGTSSHLITGPQFAKKRQWYSVPRYAIETATRTKKGETA